MDVVLERILSLLPCDENGKIVRGAKKDFAQSIGYDSGDIDSMKLPQNITYPLNGSRAKRKIRA